MLSPHLLRAQNADCLQRGLRAFLVGFIQNLRMAPIGIIYAADPLR